jgi:hypothetical protein
MASDQRPPKPDFERCLKSQALTATQRVRACSNGAESGQFVRVKGGGGVLGVPPLLTDLSKGYQLHQSDLQSAGQELRKLMPWKCS